MNNNIFTLKALTLSSDKVNALSAMNSELLADQSEVWQRWLHLVYSWSVKQIKSNVAQNTNEVLRVKNADYSFDASTFQDRETILNMRRDSIDYTFFRKENINIQDFIQSILSSAESDVKLSEDIQIGSSTFLIGNAFTRQSLLYKLRKHPLLQAFTFEGINIENNLKQGAAIKVGWSSLINKDLLQREAFKNTWLSLVKDDDVIFWSEWVNAKEIKNATVYVDFSKKVVLDEVLHTWYQDYPILLSRDDGLADDIIHLHGTAKDALHDKHISSGYVDMDDWDSTVSRSSYDYENNVIPFPVEKRKLIDNLDMDSLDKDSESFMTRIGSKIRKYSERVFKGLSHTFSSVISKFKSQPK